MRLHPLADRGNSSPGVHLVCRPGTASHCVSPPPAIPTGPSSPEPPLLATGGRWRSGVRPQRGPRFCLCSVPRDEGEETALGPAVSVPPAAQARLPGSRPPQAPSSRDCRIRLDRKPQHLVFKWHPPRPPLRFPGPVWTPPRSPGGIVHTRPLVAEAEWALATGLQAAPHAGVL